MPTHKTKNVDPERLAAMHARGMTQTQIGQELGICQSTVSRLLVRLLGKIVPVAPVAATQDDAGGED